MVLAEEGRGESAAAMRASELHAHDSALVESLAELVESFRDEPLLGVGPQLGIAHQVFVGGDVHDLALPEGFPANGASRVCARDELGCGVFAVGVGVRMGLGVSLGGLGKEIDQLFKRESSVEASGNRKVFARGREAFEESGLVELVGFEADLGFLSGDCDDAPVAGFEILAEIGLRGRDGNR